MLQNEEFIQEFVEEAITHIETVEDNLLNLEGQELNQDLVNDIFRAVHSIKGTAGFFALDNIVKLAHTMENLFGEIRSGNLNLTSQMIDGLLESNDMLRSMVEDVGNSSNMDITGYIDKINTFMLGNDEQSEQKKSLGDGETLKQGLKHGHRIYIARVRLNEDLAKNGITPVAFFNNILSVGNIIESKSDISHVAGLDSIFDDDIELLFIFTTVLEKALAVEALGVPGVQIEELDRDIPIEDMPKILEEYSEKDVGAGQSLDVELASSVGFSRSKPQKRATATAQLIEDSIRVNLSLLNDLMNLASELVLGRNRLLRTMEGHSKEIPGLDRILQDIDHITTQMQGKVMETRMQPVGNVFNKFPRLIRDISRDLGKKIELTMEGIDVELDKSIIESLGDPLTHLVRNAADHGIEKPEIREQLGKPIEGHIHLKAYHEGDHVTIDVTDDGAGIDVDTIKDKAIEKGIISQDDAETMGEKESLLLVFAPGFSMAETVTDVSGRGVGMDVVKTNIEKLGGSIDIFTTVGEGTTFRLTLPLTLAIISSLIVEVQGQRFALPQINLQEMVRIKPGDKTRSIEYINESKVLRLRGKLLPLVYLEDVIGLPSRDRDRTDEIIRVLVLKLGSKLFGLVVDSIQDDEEILVKPLPKYISECRVYSGVTIMGDGSIAMILDPQGIAEISELKFAADGYIGGEEPNAYWTEDGEIQDILLFKGTGPETLAVYLSQVARVDEIDRQKIEQIGDREYVTYRDRALMIIRPEEYLPIQKKTRQEEKGYLIIPKNSKKHVGLLIDKLYDTIHDYIEVDDKDIKGPGLYGSTLIDEKVVLVVSLDELMELACPELREGRDDL